MQRVWFNKTFSSVGAAIRLIREADRTGEYEIVCSSTNAHAAVFLAAQESALEPGGLKGLDYLDWCLKFCATQRIGIFIPGKEAALISGEQARFEAQGTRVMSVASQDTLDLLHNKARFYETVVCSAPTAAFRVVETAQQFDEAWYELKKDHAKLCIKPSVSVYGLGFAVIDEERSNAQLLLEGVQHHIGLDDLRRGFVAMETFRPMLLMEYLDGPEFSVDCLGDNGRLVCAIVRKKSLVVGQGQLIELRDDILESSRQLTETYSLNGVFNVQFREGQNGLGLLEINPRMSGGIGMACLAGPNLPYLALVGFDRGHDTLAVSEVQAGLRVGEIAFAMEMP
jgi:hypothetical protein